MLPCFYKKYLGIECPGCGMQRSAIALIKGQFFESLSLYPMLIPLGLMLIFLLFHLKFKFENGSKILVYFFVGNALGILASYVLKITTN